MRSINTYYKVKHIRETISNPLEVCIEALKFPLEERDENTTKCILPYLQTLPSFTEAIKTASSSKIFEEIMEKISLHMKYEKIKKDRVVIKNGDIGDSFYLILNGKISFLAPKITKCYLNEEEFIFYLLKLRNNNEIEMLKSAISLNSKIFIDIDEDFDSWILSTLYDYENPQNMDKKFSEELYEQLIKTRKLIQLNNDRYNEGSINPNLYIQMNKIENEDLPAKERRLVSVQSYFWINTFEAGQTFGHIALESRSSKRTATAISLTDCDLGIIKKEDYLSFLKEINEKTRKNLTSLVFSYNIFHSLTKSRFESKYSHMFKYVKFERNEAILSEKEKVDDIILARDGEFEIGVTKNLFEINELIAKLRFNKGKINNKIKGNFQDFVCNEIKENEEYALNQKYISPQQTKLYSEKNLVKIAIVNKRDLFGLEDMVDISDNSCLFNITCVSFKSEAYQMAKSGLKVIESKEERITYEKNKFCTKKIDYYIERLENFKQIFFSTIEKKEHLNEKDLFKIISKKIEKNKMNDKSLLSKVESLPIITTKKNILPNIKLYKSLMPSKSNYQEKIQRLQEMQSFSLKKKEYRRNFTNKQEITYHSISNRVSSKILDTKKYLLQINNRYTNALNAYLHDNPKKNIIFQNEEIAKNNQEKETQDAKWKHSRNLSSNIPTLYKMNPSSNVSYVDCLIMDKFNHLYAKGLLNDLIM